MAHHARSGRSPWCLSCVRTRCTDGTSFCHDLKVWSADILAADDPPHVHSVSYGFQGNLTAQLGCSEANANDVDANFAKLAARGVSLIFASGDSGSGYELKPVDCTDVPLLGNTQLTGTVLFKEFSAELHNCCPIYSVRLVPGVRACEVVCAADLPLVRRINHETIMGASFLIPATAGPNPSPHRTTRASSTAK